MQYRSLGKTGVQVSPLCLGAMNFGVSTAEAEAIRILDTALDAGINFIDTANNYNQGESERILGRWFKTADQRPEVILATKVFRKVGELPNDGDGSRCHIIKACEDSLRRLQSEQIDLAHLQDALGIIDRTLDDADRQLFDALVHPGNVVADFHDSSAWMRARICDAVGEV